MPDYRELHRQGRFPGFSLAPYVGRIRTIISESGAQTLLDYGCGEGRQYLEKRWHETWNGLMPRLYDPAVAEYAAKPTGTFDGVICTDCLEHVPEAELADVIGDLVGYARLWCFVSVCCRPAKRNKALLDGRNVHVTIRSPEWWHTTLGTAFDGRAQLHLEFTP